MPVDEQNLNCSFCLKPSVEVSKLIQGPSVYICDSCVDICHGILYNISEKEPKAKKVTKEKKKSIPSPREINEFLDQYIIGQDDAKQAVSVAVYNHYKRLRNVSTDDVEIEKSNILLLGPTGTGKTLLAQSIAKLLDVPFAIADATSLTEAGYVGDDVESVITRLLQAANGDIEKAQMGIVYLDEIDKKRTRGESSSGSRDISGEGVQQALLKLIEGSEIYVSGSGARKNPNAEQFKINTKNILFICGGAFVGIEKLVEQSNNNSSMGFNATSIGTTKATTSELLKKVEPAHLTKFGMIPELVGRLPIITSLIELNDEQMVRILTEPKNAIVKQFTKLFSLDDVELEFTNDALKEVAMLSRERKTGARGLRGVIEQHLMKLQYNLPDLRKSGVIKIIITKEVFTKGEEPTLIYGESKVLSISA